MPFKPGDAKPAGSGRKKGETSTRQHVRMEGTKTPVNRLARDVRERLEQMDLDPIAGLARIGIKAETAGELGIAKACYAELANYIYPKRKAVEHSGPDGSALGTGGTTIDARQLLRDRIAGIRERIGIGSNPPVSQ